VVQPIINLESLQEQLLFYGDISDDDPIDYHDVEVALSSPKDFVGAEEDFLYERRASGYVSRWFTKVATAEDGVRGCF
jgi:hypothetical protein